MKKQYKNRWNYFLIVLTLPLVLFIFSCSQFDAQPIESENSNDHQYDSLIIAENEQGQGMPFSDSATFSVLILPLSPLEEGSVKETKFEFEILKKIKSIFLERNIQSVIRFDQSLGYPTDEIDAKEIGNKYKADLLLYSLENDNNQPDSQNNIRYHLLIWELDSLSFAGESASDRKMILSQNNYIKGSLKKDVNHISNWVLGNSGYYHDDYEMAYEFYSDLKIPKCDNATRYYYTYVCRNSEKEAEAIDLLRQILTCTPDDNLNRYSLGQLLTEQDRHEEAVIHYNRILKLDSLNKNARRNRAWNNITLNKNEKARADLKLLESMGQMDPDSYQLLGLTFKKENQPNKALKYFFKSFKMEERDYVCWHILDCYEMLNDKKGLKKYLKKAEALDVAQEDIDYFRGVLDSLNRN